MNLSASILRSAGKRFEAPHAEDVWTELGFVYTRQINPRPTQPLRVSRPKMVLVSAALLTVVVHAILATGMLFTTTSMSRIPNGHWDGSQAPSVEVRSQLLLIPDTPSTPSAIVERVIIPIVPQLVALKIDPYGMPNVEFDAANESAAMDESDQTDGRTPATIYRDQIKARIERAWYHTNDARLGVGGCKVNISQSESGEVKQISFQHCLALPRWRDSLRRAIQQASPLPAPPDEKYFADEVTIEF